MKIQVLGLILNLIIYVLMIAPIIIVSFNKKIYTTKKILIKSLIILITIEIIFSIFLYLFSRNIFSFFVKTSGIINYAIYASKILFITSSLYPIKYLIPMYFYNKNYTKKTTILFSLKIVVNILFMILGYIIFSNKGFLFSFPICDFIFYIIYIALFIKLDIVW